MRSLLSESERIRILNDQLRQLDVGDIVVVSCGLAALDREVWPEVIVAVAAFKASIRTMILMGSTTAHGRRGRPQHHMEDRLL
ncbi:hypothetical protein [Mesorhizobium sp. B3-1-6]|uniref:hypothetical protein n=1 Tax=Mesorhizobium sp. B3-1-6 TaxID=2589895 RepID=UPI001AEE4465|nr:hypothetical protein [Mesorhizobium sp. B3-1-6]